MDNVCYISLLSFDNYMLRIILIVTFCFFILFLMLPISIIFISSIRKNIKLRRDRMMNINKEIIFSYLNSKEKELSFEQRSTLSKNMRVTINIIYMLLSYLGGKDKNNLVVLASTLDADKFLKAKVKSATCINRALYLNYLTVLSSGEENSTFHKFIDSHSSSLRLPAIEGIIYNDFNAIIPTLKNYRFNLSLWEQINIYTFIILNNVPIPDFHPLVFSKNESIILLGIRLVRGFFQKAGSIEGYEFLLHHPNEEIREEFFRTLTEFGYQNPDRLFDNFLSTYPLVVQKHIITYLTRNNVTNLDNLLEYFNDTDSISLKLHILLSIYNYYPNGTDTINKFIQSDNKELKRLSQHVINNVV